MISIIIPSYGRPDKIRAAVENSHQNTVGVHEVVMVVELDQLAQYEDAFAGIHAASWLSITCNERSRSYGGAINYACDYANGEYIFMASDDLDFHHGWDVEAMHTMLALPTIKVVGTNDLLNEFVLNGWHSTHSLVDRRYLEDPGGVIGEPGVALFEGYSHNYVDTEFIGTAKARSVFAPCLTSVVEHKHFTVGKSEKDETYEKGYLHLQEDHDLYQSRKHLWQDLSK